MARLSTTSTRMETPKTKRPGIHAKTKHSNSKNAKHYKKKYRGQGK